uniref:Uncharacterized protein n=1 Tax=Rhizophagus irregularis (strain DAOM 181602 / DAOM 197198 / MUCL 43194) TaxID=747089 RepID=U9UPR9_RHIID
MILMRQRTFIFSIRPKYIDFEKGDVIFLKKSLWDVLDQCNVDKGHGKFGFDTKPSIKLNIMVVGRDQQQKTIRNVDGKSVLDFYVEENLDSVNPGLKQFR